MARIGKEQLRLLILLGSPSMLMVTPPDKSARGLIKRGLLRDDKGTRITPLGLRALADELEAGRVEQYLDVKRKPA